MSAYKLLARGVRNLDTGEDIAADADDPRWIAFIAWFIAGGIVEPEDAPAVPPLSDVEVAARAELAARDAIVTTLKGNALVQQLRVRTPAEVDDWIQTNVVDLASAKVVLRILAYVVALLARERLQ